MAIAQIEQAQNCARISASLSAAGGAVAVTGAPMVATTAGAAEALRSSAERVDSGSGVEQRLDGLGAAIGGGSPRAVPIAATDCGVQYSSLVLILELILDRHSAQNGKIFKKKGPTRNLRRCSRLWPASRHAGRPLAPRGQMERTSGGCKRTKRPHTPSYDGPRFPQNGKQEKVPHLALAPSAPNHVSWRPLPSLPPRGKLVFRLASACLTQGLIEHRNLKHEMSQLLSYWHVTISRPVSFRFGQCGGLRRWKPPRQCAELKV